MTTLASTTGIVLAGSLPAVNQHKIAGRPPAALRTAQDLRRQVTPFAQGEPLVSRRNAGQRHNVAA
jgi:hypothetical protein